MARSFNNASLASIVLQGIDRPLPAIRGWSRDRVRHLRHTVLPESGGDPDLQPETVPVIAPPQGEQRFRMVLVRRIFLAVLVALLVVAVGLVVFRGAYAGRVYPSIVVGDVPVGGLTIEEAKARLTERAADLERGTVVFSHDGQTWTPSLAELGVSVNLDASLAQAEQLGRDGNATTRLGFVAEVLGTDQVVPLQTQLDQRALDLWFDSVERDVGQLPVDARIEVRDGEVVVVPGEAGIVVDREAAIAYIQQALSTLEPIADDLPMQVGLPALNAEALAPIERRVTEVISTPITARVLDEEWQITGETVGSYLTIEVVMESGEPTAHLAVDTDGLSDELRAQFADKVNRKPVSAVLGWDNGVVAIEPSVTGAAMKADAFAEVVATSFLGSHEPVDIPVVLIEPEIDDTKLESYGITELLGTGHSNYVGGTWERDENIRVAISLLDGALVPPGGTFSFNGAIGEITADKGYQEAIVVSGDRVGRDVGGGVCQVSTTVFRAALNAGMRIEEWYPHTFRLPNYERDGWGPGFDASILQYGPNPEEWPDFRFENYSDSWLLIEAYMTDSQVFVNIYGTGDGRAVEISAWQVDKNTFAFSRAVRDAQGSVIDEQIFESPFKG
ncbi:MAG TPA: VanW family protein [Thermomicrobiales bacterium]|nr:VanW family protein [Thermomicrobiales bacterium]